MRHYDIQHHSNGYTDREDVHDDTRFKHVGQITVKDAGYAIDDDGKITYKVISTETPWTSTLNKICRGIHGYVHGRILVNDTAIYKDDIFDLYIPIDPTLICEYADQYGVIYDEETVFVIWELRARLIGKHPRPQINLLGRPVSCPLCGSRLNTNDLRNFQYCSNPQCYAFKYRDILRYLNVTCHVSGYDSLVVALIRADILLDITDLYSYKAREHANKLGGYSQKLRHFWEEVDRSIGRIELGDLVHSLPIGKQCTVQEKIDPKKKPIAYIVPKKITADFNNNPEEFLSYMDSMMNLHLLSEDYNIWKDKYASDIEQYMSLYAFFELVSLMNQNYGDITATYNQLIRFLHEHGIFQVFE